MFESAVRSFLAEVDPEAAKESLRNIPGFLSRLRVDPLDVLPEALQYASLIASPDRVQELESQLAQLHQSRGRRYLAENRYQDALVEINRSLELAPNSRDLLKHRALTFSLLGEIGSALQDVSQIIEFFPEDAQAYFMRGVLYRDSGDFNRSLEDLSRAIDLKPDFGSALFARAALYANSGQILPALKDAEEASSLEVEGATDFFKGLRLAAGSRALQAIWLVDSQEELMQTIVEWPMITSEDYLHNLEGLLEALSVDDRKRLELRLSWLRQLTNSDSSEPSLPSELSES